MMGLRLMSHSPDSTLSANSSLTDCGNSASDCESVVSATCKRKRDCESDTPLPLAMNHKEIFHHILMARHNKSPYQGLAWNDERLWSEIAKASKSSLLEVVNCVTRYGELYHNDQTLSSLTNEFLRNNVLLAFECLFTENPKGRVDLQDLYSVAKAVKANQPLPKPDVRPHPHLYLASSSSEVEVVGYENDTSGIERIIKKCYAMKKGQKKEGQGQNQMLLLPCTSNVLTYSALQKNIGYTLDKECGYHGALAMQYGKDMSSLNLNEFENFNMLQRYGPVSAEYMAIAENDEEARLKVLRLLVDSSVGSIHSNSLVNSHKKRK